MIDDCSVLNVLFKNMRSWIGCWSWTVFISRKVKKKDTRSHSHIKYLIPNHPIIIKPRLLVQIIERIEKVQNRHAILFGFPLICFEIEFKGNFLIYDTNKENECYEGKCTKYIESFSRNSQYLSLKYILLL